FGFLDPREIIWAIHLIPAFAYGHMDRLLPPFIAHPICDNNEDWVFYYVNIFVDHDITIQYHGGGVGHRS
ncbi:hypothetical protein BDN67DRAFT_860903, partial [Paxillus ammoniavirescens]